jgi:hypothetical protein
MATGHVEAQKIAEDGSILLEGTSQHKGKHAQLNLDLFQGFF